MCSGLPAAMILCRTCFNSVSAAASSFSISRTQTTCRRVDRRTNPRQPSMPHRRGFSQVRSGARVLSPNRSHLQKREGKGLNRILSLCIFPLS
ncbi:hypothetical protein D0Y65_038015 [Glycine soja]|uniref:Uncharacterized protein n=1 Tax=Glycine soja TaxID=3848 RepID=A0A445H3F6_GLYSO|nr:hypothetical protein D0Y65_038015 [Glycine soja]